MSDLNFDTEPEPLMKEVTCTEDIIGNWVVIQQTRDNTVLQFSEISNLLGKQLKDSSTSVFSQIKSCHQKLLVKLEHYASLISRDTRAGPLAKCGGSSS